MINRPNVAGAVLQTFVGDPLVQNLQDKKAEMMRKSEYLIFSCLNPRTTAVL